MHSEKDEESLRENKIKILGTFRLGLQPPDALDVSGVGRRVVGGADVAGVTNLIIIRINENIVKVINVSIVIFIVTTFLIPAFSPEDQLLWHHSHRPPCGSDSYNDCDDYDDNDYHVKDTGQHSQFL